MTACASAVVDAVPVGPGQRGPLRTAVLLQQPDLAAAALLLQVGPAVTAAPGTCLEPHEHFVLAGARLSPQL